MHVVGALFVRMCMCVSMSVYVRVCVRKLKQKHVTDTRKLFTAICL